jgi:hypothetical protein
LWLIYWLKSSVSEFDSQLKLENTRQIRLSGGLAEGRGTGNVRANAPETNIIKKVERISPEYKLQIFANLKIAREA